MTYISGLENLVQLKGQHPEYRMILYSNQGFVYASKAFNELIPMYGITCSMSRARTLTDNSAIDAINSWIKSELYMGLHINGESSVEKEIDEHIEQRSAYSLNYLALKQYRKSNSAAASV